jgi:hypothetical protein
LFSIIFAHIYNKKNLKKRKKMSTQPPQHLNTKKSKKSSPFFFKAGNFSAGNDPNNEIAEHIQA